jgi:hypothetical protein
VTKYVIVMADGSSGRGTRGLNLYWFLSRYHGRAVRVVSSADVRAGTAPSCEVAFVGLPTGLRKEDLARLRYRQLVVFDYEDTANILLDDSTRFLSGLTDRYLKVWSEPGWPAPWKFGALPIRRHVRLPLYLRYLGFKKALGAKPPEREWDVTFLGAPTGQDTHSQRVEWLKEIRGTGGKYRFWGGLAASPDDRKRLAAAGLSGEGLLYEGGRIGYTKFFDMMRASKVVLTPKGNAPWSYRHYEAIYAGAIPVSCDLRQVKTLIPLPLDGMEHVPDGGSVLHGIEAALALPAKRPDVREANVRFLEQYLHHGDYSRKKPELLERFVSGL